MIGADDVAVEKGGEANAAGGRGDVARTVMTVEEAKQLVEEGEGLPVDQAVLGLLRQHLTGIHDWEDRLAAVSSDQVRALRSECLHRSQKRLSTAPPERQASA